MAIVGRIYLSISNDRCSTCQTVKSEPVKKNAIRAKKAECKDKAATECKDSQT